MSSVCSLCTPATLYALRGLHCCFCAQQVSAREHRPCPGGCGAGTCNLHLGTCDCPAGTSKVQVPPLLCQHCQVAERCWSVGATGVSCQEPLKRPCVAGHHKSGFTSQLPPADLSVPGWTASRCGGKCCVCIALCMKFGPGSLGDLCEPVCMQAPAMTTSQHATATAQAHTDSSQPHLGPRLVSSAGAECHAGVELARLAWRSVMWVLLQAHLPCSVDVRWSSMTATLQRCAEAATAELS